MPSGSDAAPRPPRSDTARSDAVIAGSSASPGAGAHQHPKPSMPSAPLQRRRSLCQDSPSACVERICAITAILDSLTPEVKNLPWTFHGVGARALRLYGTTPYRPHDPGTVWPSCARKHPQPACRRRSTRWEAWTRSLPLHRDQFCLVILLPADLHPILTPLERVFGPSLHSSGVRACRSL
jgi:hypothetical protein